ncbi:MAG: signal peptidase II [bacterium]|nr:signal peptidase II [Bacillota bacterium]
MTQIFIGAGIIVALDQLTKALIRYFLLPGQSWPIWSGVFHFSYVQNPGAAFGLLKHQTGLLVAVTAVVVVAILLYAGRLEPHMVLLRWAMILVLGGAVGNLVDRLRFGYVVDFLDFRVFPVFNVADTAIVTGVGLLFLYLLQSEGKLL